MAKQLKSYKDLSIRWDNNRQRFILEARAIGGGQLPFAAKSEAVAKAKQLFERWRDGTSVAVEDEWTLDTAAEKYMWRLRDKGSPLKDAKKAEFYLCRLIQKLEQ